MADKILNGFDVWIAAQGWKSRLRLKSVDNISLEGIASLRELILELAVQGKLTPQISSEEPASALLIKMAKEEEDLVKKKIIKKPKELPPINSEEFPFALPIGWEFIRLNNIGEWGAGATPLRGKNEYYGGNIPWFKSGELSSDFISKSEETVTELALKETSLRYNKVGDVLIAMYGATIGKTSILNIPATTNQAVCACTPFSGVYNVYLLHLLKAYNKRFVNMGAGGAQPNISREKIIATVIALPPLAEQHRIVAKVDELMALCDELEQQETNHLKSHQLLVEVLLGTLTQAKDAAEFNTAWATLAQHFDDLFITEDSIDQLKQTILQLAVMGKLVKQDPKDEPASVLFQKNIKEKNQLFGQDNIDKQNSLQEITEDEKPFELPKTWGWYRFAQIAYLRHGHQFREHDFVPSGIPVVKIGQCKPDGTLDLSKCDYIDISRKQEFEDVLIFKGHLLMALTGGTLGKVTRVDKDYGLIVQNYRVGNFFADNRVIGLDFLNVILESDLFQSLVRERINQNAQPNIGKDNIEKILVPLPPLNEQHRIVSKVDELFALCDRLKEKIGESQKVVNQMAEAVVQIV